MIKDYIHGAKWWKFDFHSHTPASDDFGKGDVVHKIISPKKPLLMYRDTGIDCIVVNANSDNLVHMDFVSGQVIVAGNDALQDKKIRNAVCEVMEGGREALNKRYYRISKALKP